MKYPYTVVHNGVWYPAGAEVPTGETPSKTVDAPKTEEKAKAKESTVKSTKTSK